MMRGAARVTLLALVAVTALLAACAARGPDELQIREATPERLEALAPALRQRVADDPDDADALRRLALLESRLGHGREAVSFALRAVQEQPFVGEMHRVLGEAYEGSGRPARALAAYSQAIALAPDLIPAYVHHAQVQAALNQRPSALQTLAAALRREPLHFGARLLQARLLLDDGQPGAALEAIEAARAVRPQDRGALVLHVRVLQRRGQTAAALQLVERGLARQPDDRALLAARAWLHHEQSEWTAAQRALERLQRSGPLTADERLLWVNVLMGQGREAEAQSALETLLQDQPDFAPAHLRSARALVATGRARDALREAQQAAALVPQSAEAHYWAAVAHYLLEEQPLGDAALDVAAQLDPRRTALRLLRIERLLAANRLDAAGPLLDDLLRRAPELPAALLLYSERAVLLGDFELAGQVLDRIPPRFAPEQMRFARLRLAYLERRWADVVTLSGPLLDDRVLGWRATYLQGAALLRQGKLAAGLERVRPQLEGPGRRVVFYHLAGYLYLLQGDRTAAQRSFLAGLGLAPGHPLMIEGLSRLAIDARDWARAEELLRQGLQMPGGYREVFLERLGQVSLGRNDAQLGRASLQQFLEAKDPARSRDAPAPASAVLFGTYLPDFDGHLLP